MKDKQCESVTEDLSLNKEVDTEESTEIEFDVKKEIAKITDVINNLKETALKMKGAEVKVKDWSLLVSYSEGEYIVDFKMKIAVKPDKM